MKMIFLGEAASDSGSLGFSEACPLETQCQPNLPLPNSYREYAPSCPHGVDVHSLGHIDNELDVSVVVVVGTAGYLHVPVSRSSICFAAPRLCKWQRTSTY